MCRCDLLIQSCTCKTVQPPTSLILQTAKQWFIRPTSSWWENWIIEGLLCSDQWRKRYCHLFTFFCQLQYAGAAPNTIGFSLSWNVLAAQHSYNHRSSELAAVHSQEIFGCLSLWTPLLQLLFSSQDKMLGARLTWTWPAGRVWWHILVQWGKRPLPL